MRLLMMLLLLVSLSGCANIWRMEKGPLTAFSESVKESSAPRFTMLWVNLQQQTDLRVLQAQIKLADDAPLTPIGALRPDFVARHLPPFVPPPQWPEVLKERARRDDSYQGGGVYVSFRDGRLIFVSLVSRQGGEQFAPQVAAPGSTVLQTLPLSRAQMEQVFGPPRRLYRVSEIRY